MRTAADAAALLRALEVAELQPLAAELERGPGATALSRSLATILTWPAAGGGEYAAACAAAVRLAVEHPGDLGIVASLLLRHAVLQPGEAVFLPAGGLHSYLHGTGIELLANSDNVVRAGLTAKHIDVR